MRAVPLVIGKMMMWQRFALARMPVRGTLGRMGVQPTRAAAASYSSSTRHHGGLKDEDRIFTNLYGKHDWGLKGAMKRVRLFFETSFPSPLDCSEWGECLSEAVGETTQPKDMSFEEIRADSTARVRDILDAFALRSPLLTGMARPLPHH